MPKQSQGRLSKAEGSYYTPERIAELICDIAGYVSNSPSLLSAKVIDPAAGDGAILAVAAKRFAACAIANGIAPGDIARMVARLFFAYELDAGELEKCRLNVARALGEMDVPADGSLFSNFEAGNAFELFKHDIASFDFVLGNPPYVRIHNLDEKPDSRYVEGMCDLYYPFFDIGQQLLADTGKLCFIAPSSWFAARAGKNMREDLMERQAVSAICDFGHYQVFAPYATAYTAIVLLTGTPNGEIRVYATDVETGKLIGSKDVAQRKVWTDGLFLPDAPTWLSEALHASGDIRVLNGYATNLDQVFMSANPRYPGSLLERPVVKASKCRKGWMLYPYDESGDLLPFEKVSELCPKGAAMLSANKDELLARTQVPPETWWQFGRSQGIADTFRDKVAMQSLVRPGQEVRVMAAPSGTGVYGGVYVLGMSEEQLHQAVNSDEFFEYASALRKYKSGGYYSLGGKDIEKFLNWWSARG